MARKQAPNKKKIQFLAIKHLANATIVVCCLICSFGGLMSDVRIGRITLYCLGITLVVSLVSWVVVRVMASYEEINSGKA